MSLAFIHVARPGGVDETLRTVVATLSAQRRLLAGLMPQLAAAAGDHPCDRNLIDLRTGRQIAIHQALGKGSTACRLDADALETIVAMVAIGMERQSPDLLIVNRFGKLEASGRGFCPLIAQAMEADIPVLVGVNDLNRSAFDAFAADFAQELPDEAAALLTWLAPRMRRTAPLELDLAHRRLPTGGAPRWSRT